MTTMDEIKTAEAPDRDEDQTPARPTVEAFTEGFALVVAAHRADTIAPSPPPYAWG
jgi:hypothetical protein